MRLDLRPRRQIIIEMRMECFGSTREGSDKFYRQWLERDTQKESHSTRS